VVGVERLTKKKLGTLYESLDWRPGIVIEWMKIKMNKNEKNIWTFSEE